MNGLDSLTDEELAAQTLQQGDRQAFTLLYERYFDRVFDLASRMLKDPDAAADVAQNTFMKLLEGSGTRPPQVSFRAWLYTIARNSAIDELRRCRRLVPTPGSIGEEGEELTFQQVATAHEENPEQAALDQELAALVWQAAEGLNPNEYTLLDLQLRKGLEPEELAQVLGTSRGNIYTMLSRLKDSFEDAVTALFLVRRGRRDCADLDDVLLRLAATEEMTPRRKRAITRHAKECDTCQGNRRRYVSATELFGSFTPVLAVPALKGDILERLLPALPPPGSAAPDPSPGPAVSQGLGHLWNSLSSAAKLLLLAGLGLAVAAGLAWLVVSFLPFSGAEPPTIEEFRLVDAAGSPLGFARGRKLDAVIHLQQDMEDVNVTCWLLNESSEPAHWPTTPPGLPTFLQPSSLPRAKAPGRSTFG